MEGRFFFWISPFAPWVKTQSKGLNFFTNMILIFPFCSLYFELHLAYILSVFYSPNKISRLGNGKQLHYESPENSWHYMGWLFRYAYPPLNRCSCDNLKHVWGWRYFVEEEWVTSNGILNYQSWSLTFWILWQDNLANTEIKKENYTDKWDFIAALNSVIFYSLLKILKGFCVKSVNYWQLNNHAHIPQKPTSGNVCFSWFYFLVKNWHIIKSFKDEKTDHTPLQCLN